MFSQEQLDQIVSSLKTELTKILNQMFPRESAKRILRLEQIEFGTSNALNDFSKQKELKLHGQSLTIPIRGTFSLWDKETGELLDRDRINLIRLPILTQRGTYLIDGNEYQTVNQLRLKAGVYTRQAENGMTETQVNVGNASGFKIYMDTRNDKKGIFLIKSGSSTIEVYPLLKFLGVTDAHIKNYIGEELLIKNQSVAHKTKSVAEKFAKKVAYVKDVEKKNMDELKEGILAYFRNAQMSPETTKVTLNKSFDHVNVDLILEACRKWLAVYKGEEQEDDRDALVFKKFMSIENHLSEVLEKAKIKINRSVDRSMDNFKEVRRIISVDSFNDPIKNFFVTSDLAAAGELTNPLSAVGGFSKVTIMGEGGITNAQQITDDMTNINPTSLGFIDPVHTPESQKIGVLLHMGIFTDRKGEDLTTKVIDPKTKKVVDITPLQLARSVVAFPDQYDKQVHKFKADKVKVLDKTEMKIIDSKKVNYVLLSAKGMFDLTTNMIPFLHSTQGNRAMMGGKMQEQALSLKEREAPLVQNAIEKGSASFEQTFGRKNAIVSPIDGTVVGVNPLKIRDAKGKIEEISFYDHFPLGGTSMLHHDLKVKKGDVVKKGQVLADSNYTKDGTLALGTNLNVAYMPFRGFTFEDGTVISESAAKKLTSIHLYAFELEINKDITLNKEKFKILFPRDATIKRLAKLNENGVIKKGERVEEGDILIAALKKKNQSQIEKQAANIHKSLNFEIGNAAITWNNDVPGIVQDVITTGNLIKILVKTEEKAKEGDKIVGRYGNKGTISKIVPDNEMPKTLEGRLIDVVMNPHAVPSRMNPSQILETAAGKIAEKNGKPFLVDNFSGEDYIQKIKNEMQHLGIKDKEVVVDPRYGELENPINVGKEYILKLQHQTKKKFSARAFGEGYDLDEQPLRGGDDSGQAIDVMLNYTLLAHGAKHNLREMSVVKGTKNDEYWRNFQAGMPLDTFVPSKPSFAFEKFIAHIEGLGVKVNKTKNSFQLMAMTDSDVEKMSNGTIKNAKIVRAKNLKEERGGLFDPDVTGGRDGGEKWSHVNLVEPIPNPVFENAIRSILNLNEKEFDAVLNGETPLEGKFGGEAIKTALSRIDVDKELAEAREEARKIKEKISKKGVSHHYKLNPIYKRIRYLEALKITDKKPQDYVLTKLPILPPKFRPIYELPDGNLGVSDVNELYRHMILVNESLEKDKKLGLLEEGKKGLGEVRQELYESLKAVQGLGDPITWDAQNRGRKGILRYIGGTKETQPKNAFFQTKVIKKRQDLSGRATIVAGPELDVDEIGIPEEMAWKIFKPEIMRKMINRGFQPVDVKDNHLKNRSDQAKKIMQEVINETPVMLNRAPSLHKFSTMAFKPKIVSGQSIRLPSLVTGGFNADFDGDAMAVFVPVSKEAKEEAFEKMLPSKALFRAGHGNFMYMPGHEQVLGLYFLTKDPDTNASVKGTFATKDQALKAFKEAKSKGVRWSKEDPVIVGGKRLTIGKIEVNEILPDKWKRFEGPIDKDYLKKMFDEMNEDKIDGRKMVEIANKLKDFGNEHVYKRGFTIGLEDLSINTKKRDEIMRNAEKKAQRYNTKDPEQVRKIWEIFQQAEKDVFKDIVNSNPNNAFIVMQKAGARGNKDNVRQILGAPGLLTDSSGQIVPIPVTKSYSEGIDPAQYWISMYGARKGMADRAKSTAEPGAFAKDLINNVLDHIIAEKDCGTYQGILRPVGDSNTKNRFLAQNVVMGGKIVAKRNDLVSNKLTKELQKLGVKEVIVRSPLKCESRDGLCSKCYGVFPDGKEPAIGDNIGIISGHALTEPTTQMTMDSFHSGGVASHEVGKAQGLERIGQIFEMPKTLKGKAVLAETDGTVESVIHDVKGAGGHIVRIGGKDHFVPPKSKVKVQVGNRVKKGDQISEGAIKPQELLELKGLDSVREYMTEELSQVYGNKIHHPTIETVVQKITNLTKILDPGDSNFTEGQYAPLNMVQTINRTDNLEIPIDAALDKTLAVGVAGVPVGTKIRAQHIQALKLKGVKTVRIKHKKIEHSPELKGINTLLHTTDDWMAQMNFNSIPRTFVNNAAFASKSKFKDTSNPIPAFAYGVDFGKTPGKY